MFENFGIYAHTIVMIATGSILLGVLRRFAL